MPEATSGAGETDGGSGGPSLRAGFREERTPCPVLKHKVEFAGGQGRERQRELSRLGPRVLLLRQEVTKKQDMFLEREKKVRKL